MILMKYGDIKGGAEETKHKEWIILDSVQFGVGRSISTPTTGGKRETSTPSFSEVTVVRSTDISSPELFMGAIAGTGGNKAEIHFMQTHGEENVVSLEVVLEDSIMSSYSVSGATGATPSESLSINFQKISFKYDAYTEDKVITGTAKVWNLKESKRA